VQVGIPGRSAYGIDLTVLSAFYLCIRVGVSLFENSYISEFGFGWISYFAAARQSHESSQAGRPGEHTVEVDSCRVRVVTLITVVLVTVRTAHAVLQINVDFPARSNPYDRIQQTACSVYSTPRYLVFGTTVLV
jgi:hypothetical protein